MTQIELEYEEYLKNFDPTPLYSGDGYREPMTFATFEWLSEEEPDD